MALSCQSETKGPRDEHSSVTKQSHNIPGETNKEQERPKDVAGLYHNVTFFCNENSISRYEWGENK